MRFLVFFDLPVTTRAKRKAANRFRIFLQKDDYQMMQFSVYSRILRGQDSQEKHLKRIQERLPKEGSVRVLLITEKQYTGMQLLVGDKRPNEKKITSDQLLLF
ncbi:CRISPR-associated endonuclease Cas2 [Actinobacillus delphinicola]|nr:CRISPR-associated endonuclease Cas2 [Actinobacillus delphinicola]